MVFFPGIDGEAAVDLRCSVVTGTEFTEMRKIKIATDLPPLEGEDESVPVPMRLVPRFDAWSTIIESIPRHLLLCERLWPRCMELLTHAQQVSPLFLPWFSQNFHNIHRLQHRRLRWRSMPCPRSRPDKKSVFFLLNHS